MDYKALALELEECYAKMRHKPKRHKLSDFSHGGEMLTLHIISTFDEPVSPGDLSAACGVSTARIAATLKSLENKGYIIRDIDRDDRRRTLVTATKAGREASDRFESHRRVRLEDLLRKLGEHDAVEYVRLIGRVSDIMSQEHH